MNPDIAQMSCAISRPQKFDLTICACRICELYECFVFLLAAIAYTHCCLLAVRLSQRLTKILTKPTCTGAYVQNLCTVGTKL